MTVDELRDYLAKFTGDGKGEISLRICGFSENPLQDTTEIVNVLLIDSKKDGCCIVLQADY